MDPGALVVDLLSLEPNRTARLRLHRAGAFHSRAQAAVIIPARNETRRIGRCLRALAAQAGAPDIAVIVVSNGSRDDTTSAALEAGRRSGLALSVLDVDFHGLGNVGLARRIGNSLAALLHPDVRFLLNSDADCVVAADWVAAQIAHLAEVDAVCGNVTLDRRALTRMPAGWHARGHLEGTYRQAVIEFESLLSPQSHDPWPHHGNAPGASLGFRRETYEASGGFADIACGEDRDIIARLRRQGARVRHAMDVTVTASCRLKGRAPGGMADALARQLEDNDSWIDALLLPPRGLVAQAEAARREGRAFVLTEATGPADRLRPSELPPLIAMLRAINDDLRETPPSLRAVRLSTGYGSLKGNNIAAE